MLSPELKAYLCALTPDPLAKLQNKNLDFTHLMASMSCGAEVGNFLQLLLKIHQPQRILELGTMLGYSALCMAVAMPATARLLSIEKQKEHWERAVENCQRAGFATEKLRILHSSVADFLQSEAFREEKWDFVFMDADKLPYQKYYALLVENLPAGAVLIVDNVLFRGELWAENSGKIAQAMDKFNRQVFSDSRVEASLVPIRDGLLLIRKK